ncbi:rhs core protein with extension [Shigella sonnei]|nr:rhs core protein with extension [Shigella sonnei]
MGGGKPAARQGDMTRKGLDIVQGSAGVLIGAPTGVACSVCPFPLKELNNPEHDSYAISEKSHGREDTKTGR